MLTRARARIAHRTSQNPSHDSAAQPAPPEHSSPVSAVVASSSSDEFYTPPVTPRPVRRRGRPPIGLGPRGQHTANRVPAVGGAVHRMRWTQNLNENVMRAYYEATEAETNLTAYRVRMFSVFQALEPTVNVSAQRLSDQVRAIQRCHLLDDTTLERLRLQAQYSRVTSEPEQVQVSHPNATNCLEPNPIGWEESDATNVTSNQYNELRSTLELAIGEYRYMPTNMRPTVPRLPMHKRNGQLMRALDSLLSNYLDSSENLADTHSILYCAAVTACRVAHVKFPGQTATRPANHTPVWQRRIEKRITDTRTLIGKLICFREGNTRPRVMRFVNRAFIGTNVQPTEYLSQVTERIDLLKQKIYAWANRIRRYRKRVERYTLNRMFQSNERKVYKLWEQSEQNRTDMQLPDTETIKSFWQNIWSVPVSHTDEVWVETIERACAQITPMPNIVITRDDVTSAVRPLANWKSPGPDKLQNYWLKWLPSAHARLAYQFQEALDTGSLPNFMTTGVTHLLYKSGSTTDPKNYRPITCLPTIYKLLTSILRAKITQHIDSNNVMYATQTGCRNGSRGTKELLLFDMVINQQVRRKRKDLSACWIDYKKAYDSVPHSWLLKILELYKIDITLYTFLRSCMGQWRTVLLYPGCRSISVDDDPITIKRGIFQGDSLSPLWFCLALNPLSTLLEDSKLGYRLRRGSSTISHLLYMDDLKLFARNKIELIDLLKITESFSKSIKMEFGIDKCAVLHVKKGKILVSERLELSDTTHLQSLSETETYKYLGISENLGIHEADMKQTFRARFLSRLKKVLNSLLSGGNKVRAYNGWVMPVLISSFGILKWTQTELDAIDRKVRTTLTENRIHHPRSSVMRLYVPRKCGGRGFLNAKTLHNREICNLRDYFLHAETEIHRDIVNVDRGFTPLSLAKENWHKPVILSTDDRRTVWKGKELHGRFYQALHGPDVDMSASVSWLRFGNLFGETEGFVCGIMDEVIKTNNYRKYIIKDGTLDICRACHQPGESIRHVISGCPRLANGEYLHRHNQVARIIHQQLALKYSLVSTEVPYYRYMPEAVLQNDHATLYWDRSIITDRTIVANKPDIVLIDRSTRKAILVDIAVPHDVNLVKAENDKQTKYLDLAREITDMWDVDSATIVPIVVSANGLIAKTLDQHLKKLALGSWVGGQIQKAVLLCTARIVRRFLSA